MLEHYFLLILLMTSYLSCINYSQSAFIITPPHFTVCHPQDSYPDMGEIFV